MIIPYLRSTREIKLYQTKTHSLHNNPTSACHWLSESKGGYCVMCVALETIGCSMVNVKKGRWIQKQVIGGIHLMQESNRTIRKLLLHICKSDVYW